MGKRLKQEGFRMIRLSFYEYKEPVEDLTPLQGLPLTALDLRGGCQVQDLSPLKGMPLSWLTIGARNKVRDLAPLQGMPLTYLSLSDADSHIDLMPLRGLPLKQLFLRSRHSQRNLIGLEGMKLKMLNIEGTSITDLTPLQDAELEDIRFSAQKITKGLDLLRNMKGLKIIGFGSDERHQWPAPEFWRRYDAGEFNK
jgi:internalin A